MSSPSKVQRSQLEKLLRFKLDEQAVAFRSVLDNRAMVNIKSLDPSPTLWDCEVTSEQNPTNTQFKNGDSENKMLTLIINLRNFRSIATRKF